MCALILVCFVLLDITNQCSGYHYFCLNLDFRKSNRSKHFWMNEIPECSEPKIVLSALKGGGGVTMSVSIEIKN